MCTHVSSLLKLPPTWSDPQGCHRALGWAPWVTSQTRSRCFAYGGVYVSRLLASLVPPPLPSLCPQVCSLWLRLHCCLCSVNFKCKYQCIEFTRRSSKIAQFGYHSLSISSCGSFFSQQKRMREGKKQGLTSGSWTEKKGSRDSGMILRNSTLIQLELELHRWLR